MTSSPDRYGIVPQFLHWATVVLVIVAWTLGIFGDDLPKGGARETGLLVHVSAGLLILAALIMRLVWRAAVPPPPPEPNEFRRWLGAFADPSARLFHYTLYALLVVVPVAGIVTQFARGEALPLLGIYEISSPWIRDRAFAHSVKEIHEIAAHALVFVAFFHAGAALIHHIVFRDNTLNRMLPRGK
ncbi:MULTISPECIES: cytochrome b [Bradyrhizobium]|uniref:cytochrome b n=1 Tax=Bradyrhizobium TaxID=374 RepID=UPI001B73E749|nr:cytochrome b [Bradyrhizobium diazoefficiens]MBP1092280.1 cytochrome b561 [Bradyrhizobium japonicum]WLA53325.1 cytochrome b [Bradyrhizobium diazoefficiens]